MSYIMEKSIEPGVFNIKKNDETVGTINGYVTFLVNDFKVDKPEDMGGIISLLNDIAKDTDGGLFMYIHGNDIEKINAITKLGGKKISRRKYLTYEIKR